MKIFNILLVSFVLFYYIACIMKMTNKNRKLFIVISTVLLGILMVFRPLEFSDTISYKMIFDNARTDVNYGFSLFGAKEYTLGVEYGYLWINVLIKKYITTNYRVFFFIIVLVDFFLYSKYINQLYKNDVKKKMLILLFTIPYFGFMYLGIVVRAGISICFGLNAFIFDKLDKDISILKRIIIKIILYLMAISFHRTAILFLLIELIYYLMPTVSKKIYGIAWITSGLLLFRPSSFFNKLFINIITKLFSISSILRSYQHYLVGLNERGEVGLRKVFFWCLGALFFMTIGKDTSKILKKFLNIYILGLFIMSLLQSVSGSSRLYDYFMLVVPVIMVETCTNKSIFRQKTFSYLAMFLYATCSVFIIIRTLLYS